VLSIGGGVFGYGEYYNGKRAADKWYAAHPVVKEVAVPTMPTVVNGCEILLFNGIHDNSYCPPPPAPKPSKGRKPHGLGIVRWAPNCSPREGVDCYWCGGDVCDVPSKEEIERHAADAKPQSEVKP
jgi:hypothetical protein